jgi:hypothetical protein
MATRRWLTDLHLWALATGVVFVALVGVELLNRADDRTGLAALVRLLLAGHYHRWVLVAVAGQSLLLILRAVAIGWVVQAVAVAFGVRLTARPIGEPDPDYRELDGPGSDPDGPWGERLAGWVALKRGGVFLHRGRQGEADAARHPADSADPPGPGAPVAVPGTD